jgi:hypothetical protein
VVLLTDKSGTATSLTPLQLSFLVNKTNRRTEFQFYWYYETTCFGHSFCPSSGVLRRTPALVQFMQVCDRVLPVAPGSTDDGQRDCPKHVES